MRRIVWRESAIETNQRSELNTVVAVVALQVHRRVESNERHAQVRGVERDAVLARAENRVHPRGAVHSFVVHDHDASFLAIATPGVFGPDYFLELQEVVRAAAGGPPNRADVAAVMQRHGLTPAAQLPRRPELLDPPALLRREPGVVAGA